MLEQQATREQLERQRNRKMTLTLLIKSDFFYDGDQRIRVVHPAHITFGELVAEIVREYRLPVSGYSLRLENNDTPLDADETLSSLSAVNNAILIFKEVASPRNAYLKARNGEIYYIKRQEALIGRPNTGKGLPAAMLDVDLTPLDPTNSSSRPHAVIRQQHGDYYLQSMRDDNPAYVNGAKARADVAHLLHSGDILQFGKVSLEFRCE